MDNATPAVKPPAVKPPSSPMRSAASIFMGLTLLPTLLSLYLIVDDALSPNGMFHGLGYLLGGVLLTFCAIALTCFAVSRARRTFQAQVIWFGLAFLSPALLMLTVLGFRIYFGSM